MFVRRTVKPRIRLVGEARVINNNKITMELLETLATHKKNKRMKTIVKSRNLKRK